MKSNEEYLQTMVCQLTRDTRDLYRASLTEEEAQDGWINIIIFEMKHADEFTDSQEVTLQATKHEFHIRMEMMGIKYIDFTKAMKAIEGLNA